MGDSTANAVKEQIKDLNEISLAIDSWDDVFSDFDPSPLERRVLSEDFLLELRKHYRETPRGNYVITIYAPTVLKDDVSERLVVKRLKQYFKFRHLTAQKEVNVCVEKGLFFVVCGIGFLSSLTLITYYQLVSKLTIDLLSIIFMPLGWFGIWEGFSRVIEPAPFLKHDLELFSRLSKAVLKFRYASVEITAPELKKN